MGAHNLVQTPSLPAIANEVAEGLLRQPKALPPSLFYDAAGSRLFEQITRLPEYYLTRCEHEILDVYGQEILECAGENLSLIELGAGTAAKTGTLIRALLRRQLRVEFHPIDVSASALQVAQRSLAAISQRVKVYPVVADYTRGLDGIAQLPGRKLALYLGSSIGNFQREAATTILRLLRHYLHPGDAFLLGTDLVKSEALLQPAYDDRAGVTARFNKNMLARINRELGGHFSLAAFQHRARWNAEESRMEMHLESRWRQTIAIDLLEMEVSFQAGETIHTESSYKYTREGVCALLASCGFRTERVWQDRRGYFVLHLARAV